jgi:HK97 family phage portal protein
MIAASRLLWLPDDFSEPTGDRSVRFDNGVSSRNFLWDNDAGRFLSATHSNPSGIKVDADEVMRSTVYLACLRVIGETLANLPLRIMQRTPDGERVAVDHWLHRLFNHGPNSWQTTWEWVTQKVIHLGTSGQAMDEKIYSIDSEIGLEQPRVVALLPLHPTRMTCSRLEDGRLGYFYKDANGQDQPYRQEQVTHFRWLTNDGVNGIVPYEVSQDAIGLARACEIHGAAYFGNGARPGIILSTDTDELSKEARDEIRYTWEKVHRGASRAHRPAILTGGLKPIPFEGNNADSQFLETRKFQAEEICRIMGVPPHLVGMLDRSTNNNIEQQGLDFLTYTMMAWIRRFETTICRDLLTYRDREAGFYPEFDTTALMRGDAAGRSAYYHSGLQDGWLSVNEVRTAEGKNRVDGGDQRFVQMNMQTLEQAATNAAAAAAKNAATTVDIGGVLQVLSQVSAGALSRSSAIELLAVAFPTLSRQEAAKIVLGSDTSQPDASVSAPVQPASATSGSL